MLLRWQFGASSKIAQKNQKTKVLQLNFGASVSCSNDVVYSDMLYTEELNLILFRPLKNISEVGFA